MKSETKQYIRENMMKIYWLGSEIFVLPVLWMFMIREDVKKNEKMIEDLQDYIERLGFSDKEE